MHAASISSGPPTGQAEAALLTCCTSEDGAMSMGTMLQLPARRAPAQARQQGQGSADQTCVHAGKPVMLAVVLGCSKELVRFRRVS